MIRPSLALAILSFAYTHTALAADYHAPQDVAEQSSNALQITPYMWMTGLKGTVAPVPHGPSLDVKKSFSDILKNVELAGFVNVWGRSDRFVYSADIMYVDTSESHVIGPLPPLPLPLPVPPGTHIDATVDAKQFLATGQAGYRAIQQPKFTLDVLAGLQYWKISEKLHIKALGTTYSVRDSFDWVDPIIGVRGFTNLTPRLSVLAKADIGGFGAGSDFTWSGLVTLNHTFGDHVSVSAGYKHLKVDYKKKGRIYDTKLSGPVLGATYRF